MVAVTFPNQNKTVREEHTRGIESDTELIVGSMDVEALYPSIQINKSAKIIGEMVDGGSRLPNGRQVHCQPLEPD